MILGIDRKTIFYTYCIELWYIVYVLNIACDYVYICICIHVLIHMYCNCTYSWEVSYNNSNNRDGRPVGLNQAWVAFSSTTSCTSTTSCSACGTGVAAKTASKLWVQESTDSIDLDLPFQPNFWDILKQHIISMPDCLVQKCKLVIVWLVNNRGIWDDGYTWLEVSQWPTLIWEIRSQYCIAIFILLMVQKSG